jgi:predicted nucleic acid-binding protein
VILLDTNILLRYAQPNDPAHPVVVATIAKLLATGEALGIVPQNLYEFWVVATRPIAANGLGLTIAECHQMLDGFKGAFTLIPDHKNLLAEWEALVVAHVCIGKLAHDARLVAAMRTHGLTKLLTFNGVDFRRFAGITVLDPATP